MKTKILAAHPAEEWPLALALKGLGVIRCDAIQITTGTLPLFTTFLILSLLVSPIISADT